MNSFDEKIYRALKWIDAEPITGYEDDAYRTLCKKMEELGLTSKSLIEYSSNANTNMSAMKNGDVYRAAQFLGSLMAGGDMNLALCAEYQSDGMVRGFIKSFEKD